MSRPVLTFMPLGSVEALFDWKSRQELGDGAYSKVYRTTCITSHSFKGFKGIHKGVTYAVKVMLKEEDLVQMIRREVGIMKALDSEYFVQLLFAFQDFSTVYLVEELFNGKELFTVIVERKRLSEQIAADVARQLFEALVYMGRLNLVHRDMKLENVLAK
eukprot:RCo009823